ncbi:O-antigen ligase family protein [Brevundimonas albigilva]|uniref:O-antigen ligase family protein n=1 Tax=Brevundimonas albigilva TaxID=1312364 RepID=UPI003D6673A4
MGFASVISFYRFSRYHRNTSLIWVLIFFAAVIWTASKGPLVSTLLCIMAMAVSYLRVGRLAMFSLLASMGYVAVASMGLIPQRLNALSRLLEGRIENVDAGSVGTRLFMWTNSIDVFVSHPILGVGLGNWSAWVMSPSIYPHNLVVEIASEHGIVGLALAALAATLTVRTRSHLASITLAFFCICLIFSGDAAFWYFWLALPIAIASRGK